jgi:hypothetical protein
MTFFRSSSSPKFMLLVAAIGTVGLLGCQNDPPADDGDGSSDSSGDGDGDGDGDNDDGPQIICDPGETRCVEDIEEEILETCAPTGLEWEPSECDVYQECIPCFGPSADDCVAACVGPCEQLEDLPSSEGCSFYATSMYQAGQTTPELPPDAIIVGNPHPELSATVSLYFVPFGSNIEELVEGPLDLPPGDSHPFILPAELTDYSEITSRYRSGVVHHVTSDLPIVAYLHSPYEGTSSNGSSLLLPEHMMTGNYVVYGASAYTPPSYFSLIALENETTVRWRPSVPTAGDELPIPYVDLVDVEYGEQLLNRFDNIRIDTSAKMGEPTCDQDLSGTVIEADKPVWVVSAVRGARIPFCHPTMVIEGCEMETQIDPLCMSGSDFLQEQNLPLDYWGREYVGAASPLRANESHYWRIYAGKENVTINVTPPEYGPITLTNRGDWEPLEVPAGTNLLFEGDGEFMPVQLVAGHWVANSIGSPAMVQMVPTAQFLDRYVFVTGDNYDFNYVQVIREAGNADVMLDDMIVSGWQPVGGWEVANVVIPEGPHEINSTDYFGIVQYGYTVLPDPNTPTMDPSSGYAYPGGMKADIIYLP